MKASLFPWRALLLLLAWLAGMDAACAGPVLERIKASGRIHLGYIEDSSPFSLVDAKGKPVGYALDLCLKLAEAVRKQLDLKALTPEFVLLTTSNRFTMIAEGKADMECGSTTNNAERRKKVAFTIPHYVTGARYMVRADSEIRELANFEGRTLVSTAGTTPLKRAQEKNREGLLRIKIVEASDFNRAVEMVEKGEADGFTMDDVLLYGLIANRPDPSRLKVVGKFLTVEPLAIMFSRDDAELKRILDDEMRRLIFSHEAHAIYDRWFMQPIPPKNRALNLQMNYLLRDFWKFPSDAVPE